MSTVEIGRSLENFRLEQLSDKEILEALAIREFRTRCYAVMEKLERAMAISANAKPELKNGLHAGIGLVRLYKQVLKPDGGFGVIGQDKIQAMLEENSRIQGEERPKAPWMAQTEPPKQPKIRHARPPLLQSKLQRCIGKIMQQTAPFTSEQVRKATGEQKSDIRNALVRLRKEKKLFMNPETWEYTFVKEDEHV